MTGSATDPTALQPHIRNKDADAGVEGPSARTPTIRWSW